MANWYDENTDIAVSTRIRIARNLKNVPFTNKLNDEKIKEISLKIKELLKDKVFSFGKLEYISLNIDDNEIESLVERHIISPDFANVAKKRALCLSEDESVSIMICEEDHFRIQVILPGCNLKEAYKKAAEVDEFLCKNLNIAYSDTLGFLTECPSNLGTGLRASVMLHIPALENVNAISNISDSISKIGLTVRGLYGEGSGATASLYQISNQVTLGITEEDAINNLKGITDQIIEEEKKTRKEFLPVQLSDVVFRALGTLENARILSGKELMTLASKLKLGITEGIIKNIPKYVSMKLIIECSPGMLQKKFGLMEPNERDIKRAEYCRNFIKDVKNNEI